MAVTASIVYFSYHIEWSAKWSILQSNEGKSVELARYRSTTELAAVISDVAYLSEGQYLHEWLADGAEETRRSLAKEFLAFARQKGFYQQVRFLDERGHEVVRVGRGSGRLRVVPDRELQDKSDRYYFAETLSLDRGQAYISPFDLNVEHGAIEQPIRPMIRIGTPVFDDAGRKRGVIILNYDGRRLLERIHDLAPLSAGSLWLLNSEGYWLIGPDREDEWAFMYPDRRDRSFAHAYPAAWERLSRSAPSAQFTLGGELFTFTEVSPTGARGPEDSAEVAAAQLVSQESWILLTHLPAAVIQAERWPERRRFGTIFVAVVLLEIAAAWIVFDHWSARRTAERLADRSETNFRGLLEAAPDAIVVTDLAGKVVLMNGHAQDLFGYEPDQLVGQPVDVLVPERHRTQHESLTASYRASPEPRRLGGGAQLWALRSDGRELPVDIRVRPVGSEPERLIFASVRDVTDRYQKERTIQDMAQRLARDNALLNSVNRELDAFCYSVSHDLRAPLRSMTGFSEALIEDYGDKLDDTGRNYLRRISAAATRMGKLIDDLLRLSRVTRTEVRQADVDLSAIAETVAEQLRQGDPDREVAFRIEPGVTARGDEALLRTVLENLLGNAWKYSGKKAQATIEFGVAANGTDRTFFVRDDGVGFDMAHADKLFKPFQRLHASTEFEGTGIGLASVANIIQRHGGRIWAESEPDAGTTMRFTL